MHIKCEKLYNSANVVFFCTKNERELISYGM